ncbi:addiction module antidote protein [Methylobacterium oryzisoli]|uniref:addiction module antidote protein n=1 Tax=Methylobacterium oryzisoli TaxID=3385502 RepID=UPI0038920EB4
MAERLADLDLADMLQSDEAIAVFLTDAFDTGDARHISTALGIAARAAGLDHVASGMGVSLEDVRRSLDGNSNPTLETTLAIMKALGVGMAAVPLRSAS